MPVAEQVISGLHPRVIGYKALADQTHTCVLQFVSAQDCTQHSRVTRLAPNKAAANIHMCVAEKRFAPRSKSCQGFADQLLL